MTTSLALGAPRLTALASGSMLRAGALGIGLTLAANLVLLGLGVLAGVAPPGFMPFTLPPVVGASIVGALGGLGAYAVVTRVLGWSLRAFQGIAVLVLALSLGAPFSVPGATLGAALVMGAMHVATAAAVLAAAGAHARSAPAQP